MSDLIVHVYGPSGYQRELDGTSLENRSEWFQRKFVVARQARKSQIVFRLESNGPVLGGLGLLEVVSDQNDTMPKVEKVEDDDEAFAAANRCADIYDAFFNLLESKVSAMPALSAEGLEILIDLAERYSCLKAIRASVKLLFVEQPKALYVSIVEDPPRYLKLGIQYQYAVMYREALIHCAGGFPGIRWPTPIQDLEPQLQEIVIEKAMYLADWARRVELELFKITFKDTDGGKTVSGMHGKGQRELITIFREWLALELRMNDTYPEECQRGIHFWRMWKRGDAYLPLAEVKAHFRSQFGPKHRFDLEKYLGLLKNEVQNTVREIASHNLEYCNREEYGIDYLTSLQVEHHDQLWITG